MATEAVLRFAAGRVEVPVKVQQQIGLNDGDVVRLVRLSETDWIQVADEDGHYPDWTWVPNEDWRSLGGILSGHPEHDTSAVRAAERAWEREHDERKFGPGTDRS